MHWQSASLLKKWNHIGSRELSTSMVTEEQQNRPLTQSHSNADLINRNDSRQPWKVGSLSQIELVERLKRVRFKRSKFNDTYHISHPGPNLLSKRLLVFPKRVTSDDDSRYDAIGCFIRKYLNSCLSPLNGDTKGGRDNNRLRDPP